VGIGYAVGRGPLRLGWKGDVQQVAKLGRHLLWPMLFMLPGAILAQTSDEPPAARDTVEHALATFVRAFDDLDWTTFRECFSERPGMFHPAPPNVRRVDSQKILIKRGATCSKGFAKNRGEVLRPA